ncbi:beta-L-arabinofuranosidase domain-containing protein [Niabella hibiscisoli]|uniref:beta-L-arabinofuranosidase domain-containing protein n=1 Tax=Niabella hibiscisoli TaxID=1825928 RepID=UPI001F104186|nr:beta-L-arabinofuranosidase domain-containing protein [Niabella hibiscisoli]MCH5718055.1 glycoside hydrolase family 127 protein [Niabella hibiscisoli]
MKAFIITGMISLGLMCCCCMLQAQQQHTQRMRVKKVTINDRFWKPKMQLWAFKTINDVFNKFEGKYKTDVEEQTKNNAFLNFDDVAKGKINTGKHAGFPWFDGLVYETIRGASDYLKHIPDPKLESRIDHYIDAIERAQNVRPDHYINTYTQLVEPGHEWGGNGGFLRWQHDVYNAGMLVEAGVHYYKATGKIKLLSVAVKMANLMANTMGAAPKKILSPHMPVPKKP